MFSRCGGGGAFYAVQHAFYVWFYLFAGEVVHDNEFVVFQPVEKVLYVFAEEVYVIDDPIVVLVAYRPEDPPLIGVKKTEISRTEGEFDIVVFQFRRPVQGVVDHEKIFVLHFVVVIFPDLFVADAAQIILVPLHFRRFRKRKFDRIFRNVVHAFDDRFVFFQDFPLVFHYRDFL